MPAKKKPADAKAERSEPDIECKNCEYSYSPKEVWAEQLIGSRLVRKLIVKEGWTLRRPCRAHRTLKENQAMKTLQEAYRMIENRVENIRTKRAADTLRNEPIQSFGPWEKAQEKLAKRLGISISAVKQGILSCEVLGCPNTLPVSKRLRKTNYFGEPKYVCAVHKRLVRNTRAREGMAHPRHRSGTVL